MFSIRYNFYPKDIDKEEYEGLIWSFIGSLGQNGQLIDKDANLAFTDGAYVYVSMCPEVGSLNADYCDQYATAAYERLLAASTQAPEWSMVGEVVESGKHCDCKEPSSYSLFTMHNTQHPPVICNDCRGYVAEYRLPKVPGNLGSWKTEYQACDTLYMSSGVGEMFGLRQMKDPKSKLTQDGLEICRELAEALGKPVYYFLWTSSLRISKRCPSCKAEWEDIKALAGKTDKICSKCGFVTLGNEFLP